MPDASSWLRCITRFGDSALLLPLTFYLTAALWKTESLATAIHYLCAIAFCAVAIVALKIIFMACGSYWGPDIVTPSGHAGMALSVYGTAAIVFCYRSPSWQRPWLLTIAVTLVCAVAISRVALSAHSVDEVAVGLGVGALSVVWFAWHYARLRKPGGRSLLPLIGALVLILALHRVSFGFEDEIERIAVRTQTMLHFCPGAAVSNQRQPNLN